MIRRIIALASGDDGLLSSRREWHALIVGLAAGATAALAGRPELLGVVVAISLGVRGVKGPLTDLKKEPWYADGGALIGYGLVTIGPTIVDTATGVV